LKWLGIKDLVYMGEATGWWPKGKLSFRASETGSNAVGSSRGLLLEGFQGPVSFRTLKLLATKPDIWAPDLEFGGISGRASVPSQLSCEYCSGTKTLLWHKGLISEPLGMMVKDINCNFIITGAKQVGKNPGMRGLEIRVEEINFQDGEEFLVIREESNDRGVPQWSFKFQRGSAMPVILYAVPPVQIVFFGKSHLVNRKVTWSSPSGVRFKVRFHTLDLGPDAFECSSRCFGEPGCLRDQSCFRDSPIMTTEDDYVLFDNRRRLSASTLTLRSKVIQQAAAEMESSVVSARRTPSNVDILTMTLEGVSGERQTLPCAFAQDTRQLVTEIKKQVDRWQGANGMWDGFCYDKGSISYCGKVPCAEETRKPDGTVADVYYFGEANSCSIHIEINDRTIREYRYDCNGGTGPVGLAYGVMIHVGAIEKISSPVTGATFSSFRRIEVSSRACQQLHILSSANFSEFPAHMDSQHSS